MMRAISILIVISSTSACIDRPDNSSLERIARTQAEFPVATDLEVEWIGHSEGSGFQGGSFNFEVSATREAIAAWRDKLEASSTYSCDSSGAGMCRTNLQETKGIIVQFRSRNRANVEVWSLT